MANNEKETQTIKAQSEAPASPAQPAQGISNTPPSWAKKIPLTKSGLPMFNCCIDYLKVTFVGEFFPERHSIKNWHPLLEAYGVDPNEFSKEGGINNYQRGYAFSEFMHIAAGGNATKQGGTDNETFSVELKGQGCREFERRIRQANAEKSKEEISEAVRLGWKHLLNTIAEFGGKCTRIDLPTDDLSGFIPFDEMRYKLENRIYVATMRSFVPDDDLDEAAEAEVDSKFPFLNEEAFMPRRTRSKKGGYTATLGGRSNLQLVIYNKAVERMRNTLGIVNVPSWIRYECRFYHENAEEIFAQLVASFDDPDPCAFNKFCVGCLAGMIEFKERKTQKMSHTPTWKRWEEFLDHVKEVPSLSQHRVESTVQSNALWLSADASKSLARICYCYPELTLDLFYALLKDGISKFEKKDLFKINNHRLAEGLPEYGSLKDATDDFYTRFKAKYGEMPPIDPKIDEFLNADVAKLGSVKYKADDVESEEPSAEEAKPADKSEGE